MTTERPEALIERLRLLPIDHEPHGWPAVRTSEIMALIARITELEAQLSAIGAGGVGPLMAGSAGWQPIATAPKDGDVLLWSSITQRKPIIDRWHDYCRVNHPQFTHWHPLPAAHSISGETK